MSLHENPFYILRVSCNSSRRDIVSAVDSMSFLIDFEICEKAQSELINLSKRLSAEISWFVDIDADTFDSIRSCIDNNEEIEVDLLHGLSRLNADLFNLSISGEMDPFEIGYTILEIDELYSGLDIHEITSEINRRHVEAGFGIVQEHDVSEELGKKRYEIRQLISDKLSLLDENLYIELIGMLAEKCMADDAYDDGIIISDVVDQYELRMQSTLEQGAEKIKGFIGRIKNIINESVVSERVETLVKQVEEWDSIAQPLQYKSQSSGLPHKLSEDLASELRKLAIFLNNERHMTRIALALVNSMKSVFTEIGSLAELFDNDADELNDLLKEKKKVEGIIGEWDSIKAESMELKRNPSMNKVEGFVLSIKKLNVRIKAMDLDEDAKDELRRNLGYLARGTAVDLYNNKHLETYSNRIIQSIMEDFIDIPDLFTKFSKDIKILGIHMPVSQSNSNISIYPSNKGVSASTANKNSSSGTSDKKTSTKEKKGLPTAVYAVILIVILLAIIPYIVSSLSPSESYTSKSNISDSYTVTLDDYYGTGGSYSIVVQYGSEMPKVSIPYKDGYEFKGVYSLPFGKGTKYYDEFMVSVHVWDRKSNEVLYVYWEKTPEKMFTLSATSGESVYADIVSIFPEIGIYTEGMSNYDSFMCKCKTSSGAIVWVHIPCISYKYYFDSSVSTNVSSSYAETITFSSPRRIHGTAKRTETIMDGLASDTSPMVISFSSID